MIRDLSTFLYGVALALVLGIGSATWATGNLPFLGTLAINDWHANPAIGTNNPDPYSQAYFSRSGGLPLAAAEGLAFVRRIDDDGETLNARCTYVIEGDTPGARLWTLYVLRDDAPLASPREGVPVALHSGSILRFRDGDFDIRIAPLPQPRNWLFAGASGPFALALSLYDTAIGSDTGLADLRMPAVRKLGCVND
ncbi:DUF1214 domain-containing protein [Oricola sp.]|uniref:DUF1214 domain-containing protein n=1 Tax=Oricola sp. TaxID=1979950 RepID=UPI0025EC51FE|nr:DUF1214 domain-containing protein [Oricola sp.]MCI5073527.1 DUF1214 domain-containing protein [Oricola sp.]